MNANFLIEEVDASNSGCCVNVVFNEGDTFGLMYTNHAPQQDVFMLNVAREKMHIMACLMRVLASYRLHNGQEFRGDGYAMRCDKVVGLRRKALLRTHLAGVDSKATVYEIVFP